LTLHDYNSPSKESLARLRPVDLERGLFDLVKRGLPIQLYKHSALVTYSKHRLMTTFFSNENLEFLGLAPFMPDFAVSSIVDNIILLSLEEINSTLRGCLTVVEAPGSPHQFDSRESVIGRGGITLLPFDEKVAKALPLAGYTGILSRAPARLPAAPQPLAAAATPDSR
jgi:hypothetical protein